jgi:hypothetical protein
VHVQDAQFSVVSRISISDDEEALVVRRPLLMFALVGALVAPQGVTGQRNTDPEPMSVLLVSTGLLGVFVVRRGKLDELEIDES